jgi:hypothetical protein
MTKTKKFTFFYDSPKVAYPERLYGIKITKTSRDRKSHTWASLKIDGNEKLGGSGRGQ